MADPNAPRSLLTAAGLGLAGLLLLAAPAVAQRAQGDRPPEGQVRVDGRVLAEPEDEPLPLDIPRIEIPNYAERLRDMIAVLADYAHNRDPGLLVLTRNGLQLTVQTVREQQLFELKTPPNALPTPDAAPRPGDLHRNYVRRLDGVVIDTLFCDPTNAPPDPEDLKGIITDEEPEVPVSPFRGSLVNQDLELIAEVRGLGMGVMVVEQCPDRETANQALRRAADEKMPIHLLIQPGPLVSFASIPPGDPPFLNSDNVEALAEARNLLVLLDGAAWASPREWALAVAETNYDAVIVDPMWRKSRALGADEVLDMKFKRLGARRLLLAQLDVAIADDSRPYWNKDWGIGNPSWLIGRVPGFPGRYYTDFTHPDWQELVGRYFATLLDLGYDGVVLEGVDAALKRHEIMTPLD
ncbi:hypothetical protein [Roseospirillum parvum]|uniref:Extracellular protein n=1 Tax=Roseospirillum parvum TaxID=83401 RepID=A0A1G7ZI66_9PROT|nr:hypothetical protein [Roseospirillum parvum]SDH08246.1 extracellular protein [Roseospirillum parvum]